MVTSGVSSVPRLPRIPNSWSFGFADGVAVALALFALFIVGSPLLGIPTPFATGGDVVITFETSQPGVAQLYFDRGRGFRESRSVQRSYAASAAPQALDFPLAPGTYRKLRFDPSQGAGRFHIDQVDVRDASGKAPQALPLAELSPLHGISDWRLAGGSLEISVGQGETDPQLLLNKQAVRLGGRLTNLAWVIAGVFGCLLAAWIFTRWSRGALAARRGRVLTLISLFVLGVAALMVRNPDPLINPVIFAEDGTWTGQGLINGWLDAAINARDDYFVFINVILLFIATKLSAILSGSPLALLPKSIALTSYSFFSLIATFTFATVNRVSRPAYAIAGYLFILFIPLGFTQNEIIGRILQVGFFIPLAAVMLLFWRDRLSSTLSMHAVDILVLLCSATNPMTFAICAIYIFPKLLAGKDAISRAKLSVLVIGHAILLSALLPRMVGGGAVHGRLIAGTVIETALGRSIAYPFFFPWYSKLTDLIAVIVALAFGSFVFMAYRRSSNAEAKWLILFTAATLCVCIGATVVMRPELTEMFENYTTTFPDRYFMGLNALALFLFIVSASQLSTSGMPSARVLGRFVPIVLGGVYLWHINKIIELGGSRYPIRTGQSFVEQLCVSKASDVANVQTVHIYPDTWTMGVPVRLVDKRSCTAR